MLGQPALVAGMLQGIAQLLGVLEGDVSGLVAVDDGLLAKKLHLGFAALVQAYLQVLDFSLDRGTRGVESLPELHTQLVD